MIKPGTSNRRRIQLEPEEQEAVKKLEEAYESKDITKITEGTKGLSDFLQIEIQIGTRKHLLNLARALAIEGNLHDLTDEAINQGLHYCAIDRSALILAAEEIKLQLKHCQRQLSVWKGLNTSKVRKTVIKQKIQEQVDLGRPNPTSTAYSATDREVDNAFNINEDLSEEHERRLQEIDQLESLASKFNRLERVITDRGMHLMNIANRRYHLRTNPDFNPRQSSNNRG
tara:strand:+ start:11262 stop:11945 length:684 start_codon:yes stop_codon:yes gene_type:complete